MTKRIVYSDRSREALVNGINAVADVVKVTLGPKGRNVVIEKENGTPQIINDGVTIAREVELEDPIENAGAKLIQEAALKANEDAGDGTSTCSVLVQAMVNEGMRNLSRGCNAVEIKKGMLEAAKEITKNLDRRAIQVNTSNAIKQVASISAGNDDEVGELIAEAVEKVGRDGIITVSESKTFETSLEVTEGMQFDRGYISQYFVTDAEKGEAVYENPYVLCVNKKIGGAQEITPIFEQIARNGNKPVLLIAEDIEGEALATLTLNNLRKVINVVAVKAPDFGINRKNKLEDIAILTGGKLAIDELGQKLENFTLNDLGKADKVIVTKDHTTIIVNETDSRLEEHVKLLNAKITVEAKHSKTVAKQKEKEEGKAFENWKKAKHAFSDSKKKENEAAQKLHQTLLGQENETTPSVNTISDIIKAGEELKKAQEETKRKQKIASQAGYINDQAEEATEDAHTKNIADRVKLGKTLRLIGNSRRVRSGMPPITTQSAELPAVGNETPMDKIKYGVRQIIKNLKGETNK